MCQLTFRRCKSCKRASTYKGFLPSYKEWIYHGERRTSYSSGGANRNREAIKEAKENCNFDELLNDMQEPYQNLDEPLHEDSSNIDADAQAFYKLLKDAKQELYPRCRNFSRLSFLVRLFI